MSLFAVTIGILLAPKAFGLLLMMMDRAGRRASGGAIRLALSAVIEVIISALTAPILMLIQSGSVFQILLGRDTGWQPQRRDDGSIPIRDIVRRHRWHTVMGVVAGFSAFMIATSLFLWMSPTILGLLLAIPLSWLSGQLGVGTYTWHPEVGAFLPFSIDVLTLDGDGAIAAVTSFIGRSPEQDSAEAIVNYPDTPPDGSLTERFGLPARLDR